jgi:ribonucleoside-diphosphate reductase alpha chain
MGAVQPFLSGAISKTVNLPEDATVDDITTAYVEGWKLGLKALAVYRDGCKRSQPLNTGKAQDDVGAQVIALEEARPRRVKLPDERVARTHKFSIAGHEGYLTVGLYDEGQPGEIFLRMAKEGSTVSGLMDTIATMTSLALQYGVPLKTLVDKFSHTRFEPSGFTNNPEIPFAKSVTDYVFRYLGSRFLDTDAPPDEQETQSDAVGLDDSKGLRALPRAAVAGGSGRSPRVEAKQAFVNQSDAPSCSDCGSITVRNGACYKCANCGLSMGCS